MTATEPETDGLIEADASAVATQGPGIASDESDRSDQCSAGIREVFCAQHDPRKHSDKLQKAQKVLAEMISQMKEGSVVYSRTKSDGCGAFFKAIVLEMMPERRACRLQFEDLSNRITPLKDVVLQDPRTPEEARMQTLIAQGAFKECDWRWKDERTANLVDFSTNMGSALPGTARSQKRSSSTASSSRLINNTEDESKSKKLRVESGSCGAI